MPWLILIAGPNGAGKSTLTNSAEFQNALRLFPNGPARLLNPDDFAKHHFMTHPGMTRDEADAWAANEVPNQVLRCVAAAENVLVETVLSSDKYESIIETARAAGFQIGMIYLALESAAVSAERVKRRVAGGDHSVPAEKIAPRWRRSIDYLIKFSVLVDGMLLYLSSSRNGLTLLAEKYSGRVLWYGGANFPKLREKLDARRVSTAGPRTGGMPFRLRSRRIN